MPPPRLLLNLVLLSVAPPMRSVAPAGFELANLTVDFQLDTIFTQDTVPLPRSAQGKLPLGAAEVRAVYSPTIVRPRGHRQSSDGFVLLFGVSIILLSEWNCRARLDCNGYFRTVRKQLGIRRLRHRAGRTNLHIAHFRVATLDGLPGQRSGCLAR